MGCDLNLKLGTISHVKWHVEHGLKDIVPSFDFNVIYMYI